MKWYNPEMEPLARLKHLIRYSTHGTLLTHIKQPYQYHLVPYLDPWPETPSLSAICSLAAGLMRLSYSFAHTLSVPSAKR